MLKRLIGVTLLAAPLFGAAAPSSFSFTDTEGKNHTLETHRGKWVLVNL